MPIGIYKHKLRIARETRYCVCGCGQSFVCIATSPKRYIPAHVNCGRSHPSGMKGKKHSEKAKRKIGEALRGRKLSDEHIQKLKIASVGKNKGKHNSPKTEFKKGQKINLGRCNSPATAFKKGREHPFWKDGASFEPYPIEWTDTLRHSIRKRDNFECQLCNKTQKENRHRLTVHHIDYDKNNLNPVNLIALCKQCHAKVNFNRQLWTRILHLKLKMDKKEKYA